MYISITANNPSAGNFVIFTVNPHKFIDIGIIIRDINEFYMFFRGLFLFCSQIIRAIRVN